MPTRSYDQLKEFGGKRYTGMRVGRGHTWKYDAGTWKETKVTPDRWEFNYSVVKRRAGRAPEGSGAPVGTAYHWYIVADQIVTKLDANSYMTEMVGHKLKLSHRRADHSSWSANDRKQSKQLIALLRSLADDLEARPEAPPTPPETNDGHARRAGTRPSRPRNGRPTTARTVDTHARKASTKHSRASHSTNKRSTRSRPSHQRPTRPTLEGHPSRTRNARARTATRSRRR